MVTQKKKTAATGKSAAPRPRAARTTTSTTAPARPARTAARAAPRAAGGRVAAAAADTPTNSLVRLLDVLNLFTPAAPAWPSEELIRSRGLSRSTGYRYIKALSDAGLISAVADGHYILGPRIVQLDNQIRQCDPLYIAAGGVLEGLTKATGCAAQVCALYSSLVLCVREVWATDSPPNILSRGQARPLFLGAASKIILAHLRPHQLRSLYKKHAQAIATAGLGADWTAFRSNLARIRGDGYVYSVGEINAGVFGLSAPVFNRSGHILGSLLITGSAARIKRSDIEGYAKLVMKAAAAVTDRIAQMNIGTDRTPRAVG